MSFIYRCDLVSCALPIHEPSQVITISIGQPEHPTFHHHFHPKCFREWMLMTNVGFRAEHQPDHRAQ